MDSGNLNILEWSFLYNSLTPAFGSIKGTKFGVEVGTMVIVKGCNLHLKQNLSLFFMLGKELPLKYRGTICK